MLPPLEEARQVLMNGGDLVALAEAIGAVISDPSSSLEDIRLGLRHGGMIAEQASIELRRREQLAKLPVQADTVVVSGEETADRLSQSHSGPR